MTLTDVWPHLIGWGITVIVYVATLSFTYGRLKARFDGQEARFDAQDLKIADLEKKIDAMQSTGSGVLCRYHEERLATVEKALDERVKRAEEQFGELKAMVETNQRLLMEQKAKFL